MLSAVGNAPASFSSAAGLVLQDAAGAPVELALDANTIVIGAATWCGFCAQLKANLNTPEAQTALEGLQLVFAFGDEGGPGPGGVQNAEFLADVPGEVVFLGAGSVQPVGFPSAFDPATGTFDVDPMSAIQNWWLAKNGIDASTAATQASGIALVDDAGNPLNIRPDANTLIVGAATWCGATAKFKEALSRPEIAEHLAGLRIVFAFDNEGGAGPGGVQNAEFLANMPGEVAFLAAGSVRPARLPMAYNAASGQFDLTAVDALNAWANGTLVTGATCGNKNAGAAREVVGASTHATGIANSAAVTIPGDYNSDFRVDAADYVVYRDTFGLTGSMLAADGSGNEIVDEADYDLWRAHFGDVLTAPGAFTITGPVGVQTQTSNTITWTASAGATSYEFIVSQQPDVSFPLYNETLATTSKTLTLQNGTYYVGVTAINAAGETQATNHAFSVVVDLPDVDNLIFVTSSKHFTSTTPSYPPIGAAFHGVQAADWQCTNAANNAGLLVEPWDAETIHFKAMLTFGTLNLENRANMQNGAYYNADGKLVSLSLSELFAGSFLTPISTQHGSYLTGTQYVYTGANADGSAAGSTCNNWTSTTGLVNYGNLNGTGTAWLSQITASCGSSQRLYCVGALQSNAYQTFSFDDLASGSTVPANYNSIPGFTFGSDWNVSNDTLGGQLTTTGNYVNLTQAVTTAAWTGDLRFSVPTLAAGASGLAGFTVNAKNASGTVLDSVTIDPVDPGETRPQAQFHLLVAGAATYEFVRIENPTAPGAPVPIDSLRVVVP